MQAQRQEANDGTVDESGLAGENELSQKSVPIEDPALQRLYDWVKVNGGIINCESRADKITGVRGLYSTKDMIDITEPVIQIPSKLIVSPYHISRSNIVQWDGGELKYSALFDACPQLFHPKYPHEASDVIPEKMENELGEYF